MGWRTFCAGSRAAATGRGSRPNTRHISTPCASSRHKDRDLVNQLLSELSPLDVRQLFICHKQLFYRLYQTWDDTKRGYVADFLAAEYQVDKAGTRAALFGPEPGMAEPAPPKAPERLIQMVGPWGAVRGGKR